MFKGEFNSICAWDTGGCDVERAEHNNKSDVNALNFKKKNKKNQKENIEKY